jgi:TusE/DsrC/DsvC family sulfur relay protein
MTEHDANPAEEYPANLEDKVDLVLAELAALRAQQRRQQELIDEMMPIGRQAMGVLAERLDEAEKRGWFGFGRGSLRIAEKVVAAYDEDDLDALGDNIVRILDTVRGLTQPELLEIAGEATKAVHERQQPKSLIGMLRATQDKDVRRGVGVALEILRRVGRTTRRAARVGLQPRRALAPPRRERPPQQRAQPGPRPSQAPVPSSAPPMVVEGVPLDGQGFLADPGSWDREVAVRIAAALGLELGEVHWKVIDFSRADFAERGKSPNIRRISRGAGVTTREIYDAFGKAPGVAAARIAGVPKPVGCI